MKQKLITGLIIIFFHTLGFTQDITQTIRGTVEDNDTKTPLIGATILVVGSNPVVGTITDTQGNFRLEQVPIGRISLKISYIGYDEKIIPNLLIGSAKEMVLQISLIESLEKLEEVIISSNRNKAEVLNEMSLVSARSFSVEETKRYAGSFSDPARMVSAFAGVTNQADGNNDIIVRGNSPKGILWRLEGVEIPNPNHFANDGASGGPINALNSNMLNDSDFMSGAFAPEYGNALSGVFDMKLKKGNNENREYTATASALGLDFTVEGPFKKNYNGSYLANYRYSTLTLIDGLGLVDFGGVPKYQDMSFNVNLPINKSNYVSIFGLGGKSSIMSEVKWENEDTVLLKNDFKTDMGIIGIVHNYLINNKSYIRTVISASGTKLEYQNDLLDSTGGFYIAVNSNLTKSFLRASTTYNYKFSAKNKLETGIIYTKLGYDLFDNGWNFENNQMENLLDDNGSSYMIQAFTNWKYRISEMVTLTSGLHYLHFGLNNAYSIEPRAALKWSLTSRNSFTVGFGVHSKLESISIYLSKAQNQDGTISIPNQNLLPAKAAHYIVGFDQSFGANTHLKVEAYYQQLFDVPIENVPGSTYSFLNDDSRPVNTAFVNEGTGKNYGLELTLEQYLHHGFYYMTSASIYQSLYTAMDGVERESAFSGNYIFNVLGGKEWNVGKPEKNKTMFVNTKISLVGGKRYTPIDLVASQQLGNQVRQEDQPYSAKSSDIFTVNFSIGVRRNKKKTTRELKFDVQNLTNSQAVVNEYYVNANEKIWEAKQWPVFPNISYTFSF